MIKPENKYINSLYLSLMKICNFHQAPALDFFICSRVMAWVYEYEMACVLTPISTGQLVKFKPTASKQRKEDAYQVPMDQRISQSWKTRRSGNFRYRRSEWLQ